MRGRKKDIAAIIVFVAVIVGFVALIHSLTATSAEQEEKMVYDAVRNAALSCYAVEGAYPESLEYLRENYGLAYNEEEYLVEYDAFASNLMPTITVLERGTRDI